MEVFKNIEEQRLWNDNSHWVDGGHEWSKSFGTTERLWNEIIFDDVKQFRNKTILEIAPGHGRITQFLAILAENLTVIDLNENCILKTREKLGHHINTYIVNNGDDLLSVSDNSQDLVFSFDSFVHFHANVISDYLREIHRVLKKDGMAYIHHSNLSYGNEYSFKNWAGRSNMSPQLFKEMVELNGMWVVKQKPIQFEPVGDWDGVDIISIFKK